MMTVMLPVIEYFGVPTFRVVTNRREVFVRAKSKEYIRENGSKFLSNSEWIVSIFENTSVIDLAYPE